jgi:hypothetical protein
MKWFRRRSSGSSNHSDGSVPQSELQTQPSLALSTLFRQLRKDRKYHILELGPAVTENIDFLSRLSCRIRVEDLFYTLGSFDYLSQSGKIDYEAVFQYLLPYEKSTRFDIILAWDLFNYLERNEFQFLMCHLSRYCHPGTVLFAMIATAKHIPDKPGRYKIVDENNIICLSRSAVLRPCPRYYDTDFRQLMPTFRVYNSYLLRNGLKEYLFVGA